MFLIIRYQTLMSIGKIWLYEQLKLNQYQNNLKCVNIHLLKVNYIADFAGLLPLNNNELSIRIVHE